MEQPRSENRDTMIFRPIFLRYRAARGTNEIFLTRQQKDAQRTAHNVHPVGSLDEDTSRLRDDADSGLFSLFNYPASSPPPPSSRRPDVNVAVVIVFSLSLAERTESPAR